MNVDDIYEPGREDEFKVDLLFPWRMTMGTSARNIVMWSLANNALPKDIQIRFVSVIKFLKNLCEYRRW